MYIRLLRFGLALSTWSIVFFPAVSLQVRLAAYLFGNLDGWSSGVLIAGVFLTSAALAFLIAKWQNALVGYNPKWLSVCAVAWSALGIIIFW